MFLFKKRPTSHLGIDIGASAIKLVELEKENNRHKLTNYAIFSLEKYFKQNDFQVGSESFKIANEEMAEIISKMIKEAGIVSQMVYLSVPVYSSFSTLIDFPVMSEKEIAAAIPFEARKYVPVPISEVVLDWSMVEPPAKKPGQQVLLIAVFKEIINNYNKIFRLVGLDPKAVETETFSLSRALVGNDKSAIILIDVGARSINVSIIDEGYIRLTHNLEMGGLKITKAIAQQMDFNIEEAEEIKRGLLTDKENSQPKAIIQSNLAMITTEIKKIIDSYQSKYNQQIEKCILVGGGIRLPGFIDYLTNKLPLLDISIGDPFARVIYPSLLKSTLKELSSYLAVAVGLAMREE